VQRAAVVIGLLASLFPLGTRPAWAACACPASQTPRGQANSASLVFTGRVVSITTPLPNTVSVNFRVETLYKGEAGHTVAVTTPISGALCHFDFVPRVRYTVFANEHGSTTECSGNVRGLINAKGYGLAPIPLLEVSATRAVVPGWVWPSIGVALLLASAGAVLITTRSTWRRSGRRSGPRAPGR
jgi:hypothetical protein